MTNHPSIVVFGVNTADVLGSNRPRRIVGALEQETTRERRKAAQEDHRAGFHIPPSAEHVAIALSHARAEHPEPPPDFRPLAHTAVLAVVRDLARKRLAEVDRTDAIELVYKPDGAFVSSLRTFADVTVKRDRYGNPVPGASPELERSHAVVVSLYGQPSPSENVAAGRAPNQDPSTEQWTVFDAFQAADWFERRDGRCWRVGTPHPEPLPVDDEDQAAPLEPAVIRSIVRAFDGQWVADKTLRKSLSRTLFFVPDSGEFAGHIVPIGRRPEQYVSWPSDVDLSEADLARVRVTPAGRVFWAPPAAAPEQNRSLNIDPPPEPERVGTEGDNRPQETRPSRPSKRRSRRGK